MTLEMAKKLKDGDVIYAIDSNIGSYPVVVTEESGFVGTTVTQKVSLDYLTQGVDLGYKNLFYPCYAYELTYKEAHGREMKPQWYNS